MMELLQKRAEMVQQIESLQDKIGYRQGQTVDIDMHLKYLEMYKNEDPDKIINLEDDLNNQSSGIEQNQKPIEDQKMEIEIGNSGQDGDKQINIFED